MTNRGEWPAGSDGELLRAADLILDTETAEVFRGAVQIELTRTQRLLLELLLRRSPKLVRKSEMQQLLWGDELPERDLLCAHMHNLRKAVDKPFDCQLIHTVHSEGFRLIAPQRYEAGG